MIFEATKALDALRHPGIKSNLFRLGRNVWPYYLSPDIKVNNPITIYWAINSICNLKCKMCDVGLGNTETSFWKNLRIERKLNEIDINVFKRVIDEVAHDNPFIAVNSTEPLMYKPINEAIAYCRKKGLEIGITTGGYNLPEMAESLAEAGLSRLNVSVDGPKDVHNFIRGRPDSFERSFSGIQQFRSALKKLGKTAEVYVNYTISSMNYDKLLAFIDEFKGLDVTMNFVQSWYIDSKIAREQNAHFGREFPVSEACLGEFNDPRKVDVEVLHDQMTRAKRQNPNVHFLPELSKEQLRTHYHQTDRFMKPESKCTAAYFFVNILADGSVLPYTRCPSMNLGNINDTSFSEIWNGTKMKEWRRFIKSAKKMPMCQKCDLVY